MDRSWDEDEDRDDGEEVGEAPSPPAPALPPEEDLEINGYRLIQELTRGGQGAIFIAVQKSTGRKVALKVLLGGPLSTQRERERIDQEVRILAALDHPNIVSVIDRGETEDGSPYFVMNYVDGRPFNEFLDDYRHDHPGLPDATLLKLFRRICEAINAAHLRGIVHRDLKPVNIVVDSYGEPHILDFGLAQAALAQGGTPSGDGEFVGSVEWASPEQARGDAANIDTRTDVYALGVMLYELLTGEFPYDVFGDLHEALQHIVHTRPQPPSALQPGLDPLLDTIALKALAKNREERYQTAGELARDLGRLLDSRAPEPQPPPAAPKKRYAPWLVGATAAILVLGAATWWMRQPASPTPPPPTIEVPYAQGRYGYVIRDGTVHFVFEAAHCPQVRLEDGRLESVQALDPIREVRVAGGFNAWERKDAAWLMQADRPNRFTLVKPLKLFKGAAEWPFKFLVNGKAWAGAPASAINREVVAADTATFNIVLEVPGAAMTDARRALKAYRAQIDAVWMGQGSNLVADESNCLHFTFAHLPEGMRVTDLDPLKGLPLTTLDLGEARVTDLRPLAGMATLERLRLGDGAFQAFAGPALDAARAYDFDLADKLIAQLFEPFTGVPALAAARRLMEENAGNLRALHTTKGTRPPHTRSFNGRSYALILMPLLWHDARRFAEHHGGQLASSTDAKENAWLAETLGAAALGRTTWLGGTDEGTEGYWRWISGEGWRFENWNSPEPNNNYGVEHALALKPDAWWIDANGYNTALPFLVEWP